jgi:putative nucleotidyltransferase with HDIG domain
VLGALFRSQAERLLGQVPRERLHDLTDLEQPLLKRMSQKAPGSWEHARAMANLAEQAAAAIGCDALLVRVGAYYHDLGKSVRPKFFVENLAHDEVSPHDELEPDESTDAIIAHVIEGTQILREGGIPEPVVEFAYTHHGTQLVEYFWNKCQQQGNPKGLSPEGFRYPGMKPQTKETAILMLVDSIEAASRTVDPPDRERFEQMIQRILFTKLGSGQLDECGLSTFDLSTIVTRMADTLVNMHHHRIKYPWQVEKAEQFGVPSEAVSALLPSKPPAPTPEPTPGTRRSSSDEPSGPPDSARH